MIVRIRLLFFSILKAGIPFGVVARMYLISWILRKSTTGQLAMYSMECCQKRARLMNLCRMATLVMVTPTIALVVLAAIWEVVDWPTEFTTTGAHPLNTTTFQMKNLKQYTHPKMQNGQFSLFHGTSVLFPQSKRERLDITTVQSVANSELAQLFFLNNSYNLLKIRMKSI